MPEATKLRGLDKFIEEARECEGLKMILVDRWMKDEHPTYFPNTGHLYISKQDWAKIRPAFADPVKYNLPAFLEAVEVRGDKD